MMKHSEELLFVFIGVHYLFEELSLVPNGLAGIRLGLANRNSNGP